MVVVLWPLLWRLFHIIDAKFPLGGWWIKQCAYFTFITSYKPTDILGFSYITNLTSEETGGPCLFQPRCAFAPITCDLARQNLHILLWSTSSQRVVAHLLDSEPSSQFPGRTIFVVPFPPVSTQGTAKAIQIVLLISLHSLFMSFYSLRKILTFQVCMFSPVFCLVSCFQAR